MKSIITPKKQNTKVKTGNLITIETNCQVFKQSFDGVELIVEGYPDIKLGGHKIDYEYTITELQSGMRIFTCPELEDYLQMIINNIDKILEDNQNRSISQTSGKNENTPFRI